MSFYARDPAWRTLVRLGWKYIFIFAFLASSYQITSEKFSAQRGPEGLGFTSLRCFTDRDDRSRKLCKSKCMSRFGVHVIILHTVSIIFAFTSMICFCLLLICRLFSPNGSILHCSTKVLWNHALTHAGFEFWDREAAISISISR